MPSHSKSFLSFTMCRIFKGFLSFEKLFCCKMNGAVSSSSSSGMARVCFYLILLKVFQLLYTFAAVVQNIIFYINHFRFRHLRYSWRGIKCYPILSQLIEWKVELTKIIFANSYDFLVLLLLSSICCYSTAMALLLQLDDKTPKNKSGFFPSSSREPSTFPLSINMYGHSTAPNMNKENIWRVIKLQNRLIVSLLLR